LLPMFTPAERSFLAEFNGMVNEDPKSLADPSELARLDAIFGKGGGGMWRILRDGQELFQSAASPGWRAALRDLRASKRAQEPDFTWSFPFGDGSTGTLEMYAAFRWGPPLRPPAVLIGLMGFLIVCNGLLGWWVSSSVVGPLAKLANAALRIGDGDLDFTLVPGGPDEFGQVTDAFETMREKLHGSLLRQLAEEASRKELIAHVSHDLRTPIGLIRGYAEGLRDGVASTPEMRSRYLATILDRAGELERLIELLFSYSTLDLEGAKPRMLAMDLTQFLLGMKDSLMASFPPATIRIVAGNESARVKADPDLTRRAVSNLVENAVKHGGRTDVAMQWRVSRAPGRDNGVGVAAEDLPRIFEPFFRADRARSHGSGAGLGLAVVRKIMAAQGGSSRAGIGPAGGLEVTLSFVEAGETWTNAS